MKNFACLALLCVSVGAFATPFVPGPSFDIATPSSFVQPDIDGSTLMTADSTGQDVTELLEILAAIGLLWLTIDDVTQWVNTAANVPTSSQSGGGSGKPPATPEPAGFAAMGIGLIGFANLRRRRK